MKPNVRVTDNKGLLRSLIGTEIESTNQFEFVGWLRWAETRRRAISSSALAVRRTGIPFKLPFIDCQESR